MTNTATITLDRLKELESAEDSLGKLLRDRNKYAAYLTYGGKVWVLEKTDPVEKLINELECVKEERDSLSIRLQMAEDKHRIRVKSVWESLFGRS